MAYFTNYESFMDGKCRGCENNCGGACAYDLMAEAEERGVSLDTIRRLGAESYCAFYDRAD